ncbi:hypothetical protein [Pseudomonas syringae]|uniref:hypothetical protein n=1 Tax=Pseudomonas syringae TaxID=317 RepID=UPI00117ABFB5|nr:hypothetical protein [Pseudomonas syringae]
MSAILALKAATCMTKTDLAGESEKNTNKPNDVRVSRELLERLFSDEPDGYVTRMNARQDLLDLLDLLAQPADQQGEPVGRVMSDAELPIGSDRRTGPVIWFGKPQPGFLYNHAKPATAKVVLPGRLDDDDPWA